MNDQKRREEKERLMQEVLNKDRTARRKETSDVILTVEAPGKTEKPEASAKKDRILPSLPDFGTVDLSKDLLSRADDAMSALRKVLEGQKKDLEQMSRESGFDAANTDMENLQKEIEADYGITEEKVTARVPIDSGREFGEVAEELKQKLVGNDEALTALATSFRRPYVMKAEGRAKNVIVLTGPKGSGRHAAVSAMAKALYERQIFISDEVYTMDMSLYQSGAQEGVFLQDLYKNINGEGSVICFENFEVGFPAFLRMVDALVCDGRVTLNKRYVLSKGILVENQTGLVRSTVDSLSAEGKYLVFITTKGTKAIQNSFGADFLYHVLDTIEMKSLNAQEIVEYIGIKENELRLRAKENLRLNLSYDAAVIDWIAKHFDKTNGCDSINAYFEDFYIGLSESVLKFNLFIDTDASIVIEADAPSVRIAEKSMSLLRSRTSSAEIDAVNKELDQIIGLDMVKDYIQSLKSHIQVQELRKQQGMKVTEVSKHMIFTGNPGTGKTTIARLLSRYMKAIGALSNGQLVEVTRADLVAQYVGQTAPLTMSVIKSALGGVLFIDEAYSLYRGKDDSFGLECIDTIVKAMEDNRDNLIVVLAGYQKEMSVFLESNSGLKSRFPNIIHFPDYTGKELASIAAIQAKSKGYRIDEAALPELENYFSAVQGINAAEAGNGRLARNLVEEAILKQSGRLISQPDADMELLLTEDFNFEIKVKPQ